MTKQTFAKAIADCEAITPGSAKLPSTAKSKETVEAQYGSYKLPTDAQLAASSARMDAAYVEAEESRINSAIKAKA